MNVEHTKGFGSHCSFQGIGSTDLSSQAVLFEYVYTSIFEWNILYSLRKIEKYRSSSMVQIGVALPF